MAVADRGHNIVSLHGTVQDIPSASWPIWLVGRR
jgi:hypothetical protein